MEETNKPESWYWWKITLMLNFQLKWNKRNDILSPFYQYQKRQGKSTDPTNIPKAGDFMSINLTSWVNWFRSSKLTQKE